MQIVNAPMTDDVCICLGNVAKAVDSWTQSRGDDAVSIPLACLPALGDKIKRTN